MYLFLHKTYIHFPPIIKKKWNKIDFREKMGMKDVFYD
jgi:hypothetical protein